MVEKLLVVDVKAEAARGGIEIGAVDEQGDAFVLIKGHKKNTPGKVAKYVGRFYMGSADFMGRARRGLTYISGTFA